MTQRADSSNDDKGVHLQPTVAGETYTPASPSAFDPMAVTPAGATDSLLGFTLGNYVIVDVLGKGGFGAVYRARDTKLERDVAIKFLKNPGACEHRALFEREAKAIAALGKHSGIVQIHEWGEYTDYVYFVLEFVPLSADQLLKKCPAGLSIPEAVDIIRQACAALAFAHAHNILHRDIKPENILLDPDSGTVKLADFGLASILDAGGSSILAGRVSGSPPYMSPEQASGHLVDERTDIYSMGVSLYRLLSNQLPVNSKSSTEILREVREGRTTPLRKRRPDFPEDVVAVVDKAMAHKPEDRFQTANEFEAALTDLLTRYPLDTEHGVLPGPGKSAPQAKWWRIPVAIAVALLFVIAFLFFPSRGGNGPGPGGESQWRAVFDGGNFAHAEALLSEELGKTPENQELLYALGYAYLLQGKLEEAKNTFAQLTSAARRSEGLAAIEQAAGASQAREALEALAQHGGYSNVLLATYDFLNADYESVAQRLGGTQSNHFEYKWQYERALTLLGQALFKLGRDEEARAAFSKLANAGSPPSLAETGGIAQAYLDLLERRQKAEQQKENLEMAKALGERLKAGNIPEATVNNTWRSRPLTFIVLPPKTGKSRYALESGLADTMTQLLYAQLENYPRFTAVDRDALDVALHEQVLTSYLGSDSGRLAIGAVLGARFIIEPDFLKLAQEESVMGKIVNTERIDRVSLDEVTLDSRSDPREVVRKLAENIRQKLYTHYPLCGTVKRDADGLALNIGAAAGVTPESRFVVAQEPSLMAPLIPGTVLAPDGPPGADQTRLRIDNSSAPPADWPAEGLYAIDYEWFQAQQAGGAS